MDLPITVSLPEGRVEYSLAEARTPIDDLIEALNQAKAEGATHIVGLTGNYRGAQYVRMDGELDRIDDEDEED